MDRRRTVLLVDDHEHARNFLRVYLEAEGYRVLEADDVREALRIFGKSPPQAVLTEAKLPDRGGIELLTALRGNSEWKDVPVFFVTGRGDEGSRRHAEMLGVDAYFTKPVDPQVLLTRLGEVLNREDA